MNGISQNDIFTQALGLAEPYNLIFSPEILTITACAYNLVY
jgi:hypothetical protein